MRRDRARQILQQSYNQSRRNRKPVWRFFQQELTRRETKFLDRYQEQRDFGDYQEALMALAGKPGMARRVAARYLFGSVPVICYEGPAISSEGTSIKGDAAPAIKSLMGSAIQPGMKVLDFGAGKYARNADYLRGEGVDVYAYDLPDNANSDDGWKKGNVSSKLPPKSPKFDVAITAFVLNVVRCSDEKKIVQQCRSFAKKSFHITRNEELYDAVKDAVRDKRDPVWTFFKEVYAPKSHMAQEEIRNGYITDDTIRQFCYFGVQTSKGFQRWPYPGRNGLKEKNQNQRYTIYEG